MASAAVFVAAAVLLAALLFPDVASAHALVGRKDLPVPAWLFAWGASLVLIISFALLSVAWTTARLQKEDWRPTPRWFSRAVLNPRDPGDLRAGRRLPALPGPLRRFQGDRGPDAQLLDHLRLLHVLAWHGRPQRPAGGRLPRLQPMARDRARGLRWLPPGRGSVRADAVQISGVAGPLARGARRPPLRLAGADCRRGHRADAPQGRRRDGDLHDDHVRLHGPVRGRGVDRPRRGVQCLFRDVLPAGTAREARRPGRAPQVPDRRAPVGRWSPERRRSCSPRSR